MPSGPDRYLHTFGPGFVPDYPDFEVREEHPFDTLLLSSGIY